MKHPFFTGKGMPIQDVMNEALRIAKDENHDEAKLFMDTWRSESSHADANFGYCTGYYSEQDAALLQRVFRIGHPIFGSEQMTDEKLTKREYFAAMAMQGLLASAEASGTFDYFAGQAIVAADALIAELEKGKQ